MEPLKKIPRNVKLQDKFPPKEEFVERIEKLIGKEDAKEFFRICYTTTPHSIRCNTLKISVDELKNRLEKKGWEIEQPLKGFPEVMIVKNYLKPGELGKQYEHLLGYYYVQEISSMLPILALQPKAGDLVLDLCASPGSKTTQAAAMMENKGVIIANEVSMGRLGILSSNLEKCGVANTIVTRNDGVRFCKRFSEKFVGKFDKILVDAPCSGEGTLRKSPKTFLMWNKKMIKNISKIQKHLAVASLKILKVGGEMIYSTCTLAPEEDEEVVNFLVENFDIEILPVKLPLKMRCGVCEWEGQKYSPQLKNTQRLYPQDNNTDGFFVAKIKKLSDKCLLEDRK